MLEAVFLRVHDLQHLLVLLLDKLPHGLHAIMLTFLRSFPPPAQLHQGAVLTSRAWNLLEEGADQGAVLQQSYLVWLENTLVGEAVLVEYEPRDQ